MNIKMNTNATQNSTLNQLPYNHLWTYVSALSLIICVLLVTGGNALVITDIYRKTFRTLTADLLIQLLLCDMFLVLLLPLVAAISLITKLWIFGDTFCIFQGMAIQIVSTLSYLLRMTLAFERLSFVLKRRGMNISVGSGIAVSVIFFCISVMIAAFPSGQGYRISYLEGLHSCHLSEEWQSVSQISVVLSVPCAVVLVVSIVSLSQSVLCKRGIISPIELTENRESTRSTKLLYLGPRNARKSDQYLFRKSSKGSTEIFNLYSESRHGVISTGPEPETSSESGCISGGERRATSLLSKLNIAITATVTIRLVFHVASQYSPNNKTFQTSILVCYVFSCIIQTVALLTTSSRFQSANRPVRMLKRQSTVEKNVTVANDQPFVVLIPRDDHLGMPAFLKTQTDLNILTNLTNHNRHVRRLSMPDNPMGSSVSVNIDRTTATTRRRLTISVM